MVAEKRNASINSNGVTDMLCGKADAIVKNSQSITAKPFGQSYKELFADHRKDCLPTVGGNIRQSSEEFFANHRKDCPPIVGKNSSQSSEKLIAVGFLIVWLENFLR